MKIDDSVKNRFNIVMGTLIIFVAAIFMIFILVVGGSNTFTDKNFQSKATELLYLSGNNNSESILENSQENDNLVSGSNSKYLNTNLETEPGCISQNVVIDPTYELPLCIEDQDDIDALDKAVNITLIVKGGYLPTGGTIELMQVARFYYNTIVPKGTIDLIITSLGKPAGCDCCSCEEYEITFKFKEKICLVSTKMPILPPCWSTYDVDWCGQKKVDLQMDIDWTGCWFSTIPASDFQIPKIPPTPQ